MYGTVNCRYISHQQWQQLPADAITVNNDHIYIFHGVKESLLSFYDACYALLTQTELETASRFYHAENRTRYIIQHGILRLLLGKYSGISAPYIRFRYNTNKKPYLDATVSHPCFFNLSHSDDDFLIALGPVELGVDIEKISTKRHWQEIASQFFSAAEVEYINASPNPDNAFFLLWTRKEALLKACGTGLDDNLPEMPSLDGQYALPNDYPAIDWLTESFAVNDSFMGSVTYPKPGKNIGLFKIDVSLMEGLSESY